MNNLHKYFEEINNPEEFVTALNHGCIRHAIALNKIAHKYGTKDSKLFINDCATSTLSLIEMGRADELVALIDAYKNTI